MLWNPADCGKTQERHVCMGNRKPRFSPNEAWKVAMPNHGLGAGFTGFPWQNERTTYPSGTEIATAISEALSAFRIINVERAISEADFLRDVLFFGKPLAVQMF